MNIDRKIENIRPDKPDIPVTLKRCGNVYEIRYMKSTPNPAVERLDADNYINLRTGEVKPISHKISCKADLSSVSQSLRNLRDLINTNLPNPDFALWTTYTYAENMQDTAQLYQDFRRFWQRFCYYLKKCGLPPAEYIIAAEPQGRGAWHLHGLLIFPEKAPFVPNREMEKLWRQGYTKTKRLSGVSNPGLYLTAYLGDMEINEAIITGNIHNRLSEVTGRDGVKKGIVKGARLYLYPSGFHLYRTSRGIKRPVVYQLTEAEAQMMVAGIPLVYEKTISVMDGNGNVRNIINYRQYSKSLAEISELSECNEQS